MPDDPTAEPANGACHSVARGRGVQDRADSVMTGRANRPLVVTGPETAIETSDFLTARATPVLCF